jgi:hypothetical protein
MGRERIQTRADSDTVEQIEKFRDEKDISQSEATRRLLRKGLQSEGLRGGGMSAEADAPADITTKYTARTVAVAYMVSAALGSGIGAVIVGVL